jgi:predicted transcriptional regulator
MRSVMVTNFEKSILEACETPRSMEAIARAIGKRNNSVQSAINNLIELQYMKEVKMKYQAENYHFYRGSQAQVVYSRARKTVDNFFLEVNKYVPTDEEYNQVLELHKLKFSRTEIAKKLNMKKSRVLWTLSLIADRNDSTDSVFVNRAQYEIYNLIKNEEMEIDLITKKLSYNAEQVKEELYSLSKIGAVQIREYNQKLILSPMDKIVRLKSAFYK